MPAISKIRFTNVIYENGGKRYNDDTFQFDGHNGAILLENGGGKTVFIQTAIQSILPHQDLEDRKIRDTLSLEGSPCHIAIEWILNERPRKYLVTAVTLFLINNRLDSYRYVYEYGDNDEDGIDNLPFSKEYDGKRMATGKSEINDYYSQMKSKTMNAKIFNTIKDYHEYIEENYKIIPSEWRSIARINGDEGGVEKYFENCRTTSQLVDKLLIPVVEEAISENSNKDFSDIFEEQRERFKKHKQLREMIEESKEIQKKVNEYVNIFERYHSTNQNFIEKQKYAKSIYLYIEEEKLDIESEIFKIEEDIEKIKSLHEELKSKEISYELAVLKEELEEYKLEFNQAKTLVMETNYDYDQKIMKLSNLKIAEIKKEIKEKEDTIKGYKARIEILESDIDIEDIKFKLKENSSKLRGYFISEEEKHRKEIEKIKDNEKESQQQYKKIQQDLRELEKEREDIIKSISEKNGKIEGIQSEIERIFKKIIGLSPNEDIITQQKKWTDKVSDIEQLIVENVKTIKNLDVEKNYIDTNLPKHREDLTNIVKRQVIIKENLKTIYEKDKELLIKVKELSDSFYHVDSIYKREDSIINYMENKIQNLKKEKEKLLLEERIIGRFKDDYENKKYFTPEPLIEEWNSFWKNQFKYIETGTQYIQRASKALGIKEEEILNKYPYWSMSIIVDDNEVEILKDKLFNNVDKITFPIIILGQDEASNIIKEGRSIEELLILPKHWEQNINQECFEEWKIKVSKIVDEVTHKRKDKEKELTIYSDLLKEINKFLTLYPYQDYNSFKEEKSCKEEEIEKLLKEIEVLKPMKKELNIRKNKNEEAKQRLEKEKYDIDNGIKELEIGDGAYKYLADYIETIHLEESFYTEFPYNRKRLITKVLDELKELETKRKQSESNLDNQKHTFSNFCNDNIKDTRLRERTISVIKQKIDYEEVLKWQQRMKISIERTIKVAEDDIRGYDKDLEQFIEHLVVYLRELTKELGEIPKKTRIKVDDNWKEIYEFNIPEWKEEEAKEDIRKHIDWMIKQLNSNQFKNEDETDNKISIRKEIEKWLDSKQLLMLVLKNNHIKIRCRKVSNDGKVSNGFNTWENSNRWSGGEKWSKNMTLFLGILNYVAEKRQGIITGLKTNRTVIMDNPFGKASSDHVLDPVFFIAEKLGFQIIALTAHTEGSFIRNYFPVVYSCRLRETTNNESLIIDKEKEIQYAFFKDKDPQIVNRLEEREQITLFS